MLIFGSGLKSSFYIICCVKTTPVTTKAYLAWCLQPPESYIQGNFLNCLMLVVDCAMSTKNSANSTKCCMTLINSKTLKVDCRIVSHYHSNAKGDWDTPVQAAPKPPRNSPRRVPVLSSLTWFLLLAGPVVYVLDLADRLISKAGPFAAAGIMVGSIYWTAVTYGAVTVMQVWHFTRIFFFVLVRSFELN